MAAEDVEYFSRTEAAAYCKSRGIPCSKGQLNKLATVGGGPPFEKFRNGRVLYPKEKLKAWILDQFGKAEPEPQEAATAA
jgi:hypothetical protein